MQQPEPEVRRRDNPDAPLGHEYYVRHDFEDRIGVDGISVTLLLMLREIHQREGHNIEDADERLVDVLDPEALDGLFRPVLWRTDRDLGRVTFTYAGCRIAIFAIGEIVAQPLDEI